MPFGKIYKVNPQAKEFVCGFVLVYILCDPQLYITEDAEI